MVERDLKHLFDDLRSLVSGEILTDELSRSAYSTDASILQVRPVMVVAPKTVEELADVVKYAQENNLPIHPRGAGTGFAGESLGPGLMIDCCRHLNQILSIGEDTITVQPGVRHSAIQKALAKHGRMFAPDPVSGDRCTIGGMLATNAAGPHSLRYGTTNDHTLRLKAILATGELVELERQLLAVPHASEEVQRIKRELTTILSAASADISREQPAFLRKVGGYHLRGVLKDYAIDFPSLLVGSEGTLALFAEAVLYTTPIPPNRGILLTSFPSLESAVNAVMDSLEFQPTACEILDRRLLSLVREANPLYREWLPEQAEALLLIEQEGLSEANVRDRLQRISSRLIQKTKLISEPIEITTEPTLSLCWEIRNQATPRLIRNVGRLQPVPFVESLAVSPDRLPDLVRRMQDIMKKAEVTASYASHAGIGILQVHPLMDLRDARHRELLDSITQDTLDAVKSLGGTCIAEHGAGLLRSGLLPKQFPKLYPLFTIIKGLFDRTNILNPGRIVGADAAFPHDALRISQPPPVESTFPKLQLLWNEQSLDDHAVRCNGCGNCRTASLSTRMCPMFRAENHELAAPRSKANLVRQMVFGQIDAKQFSSDEFREIADYCIDCKMCRVECPSSVDIAKLMAEAKAANIAEHGLSRDNWFFANLEFWAGWGSRNATLVNPLLKNRVVRWLAEKIFGLSRQRVLPKFRHGTFLRRAARMGWTRKPKFLDKARPSVALFVDTFVNNVEPHLGECAVRVLEQLGVRVYVPPEQRASGMASLQYGDVESARECLKENIETFSSLVREGYEIVTIEPSSALMFRHEARWLVTDPDLDLLANRTYEFSEYVGVLDARGEAKAPTHALPVTVGYHEPCHQRALMPRASINPLLRRIPEFRLHEMDLGCSGMAGTFGMRAENFTASLSAGAAMLGRLARNDLHMGMTQCSACRMQMEQGADKRTLHPAEWLAAAYGIVPNPEFLFRENGFRKGRR